MGAILLAVGSVILIMGGLFALSKSDDPVEKRKDADDREESSGRLVLDDYKQIWPKEVKL